MTRISGVNPIVQRITQLRNEAAYSAFEGNYKNFKNAVKEQAKLTLENYELAKQAGRPSINHVPLFSKIGMRMFKVLILNFFRIKTPEEKKLKELGHLERMRKQADGYIKRG